MTLIKRNDNALPSVWNNLFEGEFFKPSTFVNAGQTMPAVNILDNPNDFEVQLAAPGLKKEQFNIDLVKKTLKISASNQSSNEETGHNFSRREFNFSSFERSFNLPETVDMDKVSAKYEDGILKVIIPKLEAAKDVYRKIDIA